jgi:monoamine oxidase
MEKNRGEDIIIIGAGLSGLTLAYELSKKGINALILEASPRLGGRIETITGVNGTPLELGATWFSNIHGKLCSLVDELDIERYPQFSKGISLFETKSFEPAQQFYVPESDQPSFWIAGGTQTIIERLHAKLKPENIHLNAKVNSITQTAFGLALHLEDGRGFDAHKAIICIPPQLAFESIDMVPSLPERSAEILPTVQTWMAGAIKFTLEYATPFWRNNGYSGMLYSHAGIITEMYDHTNMEETRYGFTGFLNGGAANYPFEIRKEAVLKQLEILLGPEAGLPLAYYDKIWTGDLLLAGSQIIQRPHQNNGHPILQDSYMEGKLYFCNTETALEYAGYMEGAVSSAHELSNKLSSNHG